MAGQIITLTSVSKNDSSGVITFNFSNGEGREFADFAAAKTAVAYLDTDPAHCQDALIAKTIANSPDGTNLQNMVGGSFSAAMTADTPFVLTEPV